MFDIKEEGKKSKLDLVIDVLKEVYAYKDDKADYSNYALYVTGHSLGGALAQLLAFMLAGMKEAEFIPRPVISVTFASPVVGNEEFCLTHQDLEKEGKLKHIRVSNDHDVVPGSPGFGYTQTGVNIHVKDTKAEVGYPNTKSIQSLLHKIKIPILSRIHIVDRFIDNRVIAHIVENPEFYLKMHSLQGDQSYEDRTFKKDKSGEMLNSDILNMTIDEIYKKYAE